MTDLTLTPDQRAEALAVLRDMCMGAIDCAIPEPWDVADRYAARALDALLPLLSGWRPEPVALPDARAAAEAMRSEADLRLAFETGRMQAFSEAGAKSFNWPKFTTADQSFAAFLASLPAAPPPDAIAAAEARGRAMGIEEAAVWAEDTACGGYLDGPSGERVAGGIRALSSTPAQEADRHG